MNDNKSIGWEEIVRRNCYTRPTTAEDAVKLAKQAITAVRAALAAAEERAYQKGRESMNCMVDGTAEEIRAAALKEAVETVEGHIEKKLNYDFRTNLTLYAVNNKLREVVEAFAALSPKDITSKKE